MEQPDYLGALAKYRTLDPKGKAFVDDHLYQVQTQGGNPLDVLQRMMAPRPTRHRVSDPSWTSGVRG
jgi:uncharacterized protein with WD repeat